MSNTNSTNSTERQEVTQLSREEFTLVADISAGKVKPNGFTYTIPITVTTRCVWCLLRVAPVRLTSGDEFNLELETGDHRELRAILTSLHSCPEAKRWEQSDAPLDSEWEGDAQ